MSIDLTKNLLRDPAKIGELECFLSSKFGGTSQIQSGKINYGDRLEVFYNNKGKVSGVKWLNEDSENMARDLVSEAEDALYGDHGTGVGRCYVFSKYRIQGFVRVKNDIQIVPLPDEAPKPDFVLAKHPGLLEYSYPKSSNQPVDQFRRTEREREILLLLNVLLRGGLTGVSSSFTNHQWVNVKKGDRVESEFCQLGYTTTAIWKSKDSAGFFSEESLQPVQRIPENEYYEKQGHHLGDVFSLPDNFEKSLAAYESLSTDDRERFLRAAHWYQCFDGAHLFSRSLAYAVLVFALEALMPPDEEQKNCDACKRPYVGEGFRDLLHQYGAGVSQSSVSKFSALRSKYVHGRGLMPSDEEVIHGGLSPKKIQEWKHFEELFYPCKRVLINWLFHSDHTKSKQKK